jgi:hypothetical protein
VARVKDGCQAHTGRERLDNNPVNLVVNDVAILLVIDWVDNLIIAVLFVTVEVFRLASVT